MSTTPDHHQLPPTPTPPPNSSMGLPKRQAVLPRRHHRVRWTLLSMTAIVVIILGTGGWLAYRAISVINTKKLDGSKLSILTQLKHIVTSGGDQLQGEADDRINILLLGYGGPGHDGPYLTDTMMVVSVQPSTKSVALISIPRDLVVDIPGYDYRKINSVLSFGRDNNYPGGGEALTVNIVSDVLNLPIQYYARVDFDGFVDVINQVGGVTVTVDRAFSDYQYPNNSYGYDPITFKAGEQKMDGSRALKFARSRHGNNGEGSDFARAARQQKVILALKDKLLSFGTLSNPKKLSDILGSLGSHSQTNMEVWEMLRLAKIAGDVQPDHIINKVYDDSADGFLKVGTGVGGAFILVPRSGNYHDMQFLARNVFADEAAVRESAHIMVVNATSFSTLGTATKQALQALGLDAVKSSTLTKTTIGQTVLVAARPGQFPATEKLLSLYTHAVGTLDLANWSSQTNDTTLSQALSTPVMVNVNGGNTNSATSVIPDIIVVLGQDQPKPSTVTTTPATPKTTAPTNTSTKTTNTNTTPLNTNTVKNSNANTTSSTNTNVPTTTNTSTGSNTNASL